MKFTKNIPIYWWLLAIYMLLTLVLALVFGSQNFDFISILTNRGIFVGLFIPLFFLKKHLNKPHFDFASILICYAFLASVYKETALLNTLIFEKKDALLMQIDQQIFGYQPSLVFSQKFNQKWFSESMFAGYLSYYLMPIAVLLALYRNTLLPVFSTILIASFNVYYILFILFPAAGPQFYFEYPDNYIQAQGVFGKLIQFIQSQGEAPTAAFPSSHIGITTIILLWLWHYQRPLWKYFLPFAILLFFATVYIKAHYAIDALTGVVSGILIYHLMPIRWLISKIKNHE